VIITIRLVRACSAGITQFSHINFLMGCGVFLSSLIVSLISFIFFIISAIFFSEVRGII